MDSPRVSVLLAVYNGEPWLAESIESVLAQSFGDLELVVVDDGSTDSTPETLAGFDDPRVVIVRQDNAGQTVALNHALELARGELLARLDSDDVALPARIAAQVAFLDAHPEVVLLGTASHEIAPDGQVLRTLTPPAADTDLRRDLIRRNPFTHSSVMFRRAALEEVGPYDPSLIVSQDYDLWLRLARIGALACLPEPLVLRRMAPGQISMRRDSTRLRDELVGRWRAIRSGTYPAWCLIYALRTLVALAIPHRLRDVLRALRDVLRALRDSAQKRSDDQ